MEEFMRVAIKEAEENLKSKDGGPFGACVVKDGKIVGRGRNKVLKSHDPTSHAEVNAIRDAAKNLGTHDLSGCEIYTSSYPCPMCLGAIIWANINKVYYANTKEDAENIGFRDDFIYQYISLLAKHKENKEIIEFVPLLRDEAIKTFKEYDKKNMEIY